MHYARSIVFLAAGFWLFAITFAFRLYSQTYFPAGRRQPRIGRRAVHQAAVPRETFICLQDEGDVPVHAPNLSAWLLFRG